MLAARCRPGRSAPGRRFILTNADGVVTAATPPTDATIGRRLIDLLGPTQPLTTFGAGAGVMEITLPDDDARNRHRAHAQSSIWPDRGRAVARRGAGVVALSHHPDDHAFSHHRLRRADPRLRLPLAGDTGAGSGLDLRNGPQPHRYRAQPGPLRAVGLGPCARPHLLVAIHVRNTRAGNQRRPACHSATSMRSSIRTT